MRQLRRPQKYFDITNVLNGVGDGAFMVCAGLEFLVESSAFEDGDMILLDRDRSGRKGDLVIWSYGQKTFVSRHEDMDFRTLAYDRIEGVVVALVRDYRKRAKKKSAVTALPSHGRQIRKLRDQLSRLEWLPENEAVRFRLETEIANLERESERDASRDEWPEVIGGDGDDGGVTL